jgi:uncharacterized protein YbjT (DUF2867 family)
MGKIMIAGATGTLGLEITRILHREGFPIRALVHKVKNIEKVKAFTKDIVIVDARKPNQLKGVFEDVEVVFSTIGKSVSLFKQDPGTYDSIDFEANRNLIREAHSSGVGRIVYTSIMGSAKDNPLKLAQTHFKVEQLIASLFDSYTILRPTGFFSGLHDWITFSKRGFIPVVGDGSWKTNSIYQKDLAEFAVQSLREGPKVVEIGGPQIHSRLEMAEILRERTGARIIHIPETVAKGLNLPLRLISPSLYHNLDYFRFVCTRDMVGEKFGQLTFKEYVEQLDLDKLP